MQRQTALAPTHAPNASAEAARLFVSYRRNDVGGWTMKLCESLKERFGDDAVFIDIEDIRTGEDFESRIREHLLRSTALIAVIGEQWHGRSRFPLLNRIHAAEDWVRRELELARDNCPLVFPVLLENAGMPNPHTLPPSLAYLPALHAVRLRTDRWASDVQSFIHEVDGSLRSLPDDFGIVVKQRISLCDSQARRRAVRRMMQLAVLLLGVILFWPFFQNLLANGTGDGTGDGAAELERAKKLFLGKNFQDAQGLFEVQKQRRPPNDLDLRYVDRAITACRLMKEALKMADGEPRNPADWPPELLQSFLEVLTAANDAYPYYSGPSQRIRDPRP